MPSSTKLPWSSRWSSNESDVNSVVQLNRLIERLCDAGVDFVIVGGFAGVLHGSSLVTRDLDVCAVLSAENIAKLRTALGDLHPTHRLTPQRLSFLDTPEAGLDMKNLYLETQLGPVDFLGTILGVGDFERVRAASIEIGIALWVDDLDSLSTFYAPAFGTQVA